MLLHLISAKELHERILQAPEHLRILDCRHRLNDAYEGFRLYQSGHIPTASHAHMDRDYCAPPGFAPDGHHLGRHPLLLEEEFLRRVAMWGISPATQVVVYDDAGGAYAARLWWHLRAVGHLAVRVLDGGFSAWQAQGFPVETKENPLECGQGIYPGKFDHSRVISFDEVKLIVEKTPRHTPILDARGEGRFRGEAENLDIPGGHIPGAHNFPYANNLKADQTFKTPEALRQIYGSLQGAKPIASCGSGVTACHLILALEIAGIKDVRLFVESYSGWCRTPGLPIKK